jgi:hypothetical protein
VRRRPSSVLGEQHRGPRNRKRLHLHFQIHFRVNISGVERDVPQPGTDGVDVDARPEKMGCRRAESYEGSPVWPVIIALSGTRAKS